MADYDVTGKLKLDSSSFIASANAASNSMNNLNGSSTNAGLGMKMLKRGALAAATAMAGLAAAGIKAASDYQQAEIAFTTMLGSAEKATTFLKDMRDFAAKTPFELPDLLTGARRLMAMGFAAEEVKPMLTAVGDAASGLGVGSEGINRITLALGQMKAKGKVSGEELRQLAEAGIPALQYLSQAAGVTTGAMQKMIESGAVPADQAIKVLTYGMENGIGTARGFAGMMDKQSQTMSGLMSTLKDTIRNAFVDGFQKYVPKIGEVFSNMITKVEPMVNGLIEFLGLFIGTIGSVAGAIVGMLRPVIDSILIPAFKMLAIAVVATLKVLKGIGDFINKHIGIFQTFATIILLVAAAYGALYVGGLIHLGLTKAQVAWAKLHDIWMKRQAITTGVLTKAQKLLNLTMAFNPIGLILAAVALLVLGFMVLWKHSEGFRKAMIVIGKVGLTAIGFLIRYWGVLAEAIVNIVTGPMKLFLKLLSFISPDAKKAYDGLSDMTKGVGKWFDDAAAKVEGFKKNLDAMGAAKEVTVKVKTKKDEKPKAGEVPVLDLGGGGSKGTGKSKAQLALEAKIAMQNVVRDYNDFIMHDFAPGFMKDSQTAADTVAKGLDEVKKVFDEAAKGLEGKALSDLNDTYTALDTSVRQFIPQAQAVGAALESINAEIADATKALEDATKARAAAVDKFAALMRKPFGEPSELEKSLSTAEASVDSIISMYDKLVETINERYTQIDSGGQKDALLSRLYDQTAGLIKAAKARDQLIKDLEKQKDDLADVLSDQASFKKSASASLRDFATALADLSGGDASTTIQVIKTASGMVVTQIKQSAKGVDAITTQLKDRLAQVTSFSNNINALLAKGLNKDYIQQLIEAGPEAAGATADLLAKAGADQINEINSLYSNISKLSDAFGTDMSKKYYDQAATAAQALIDGTQSKLTAITTEMTTVKDSIEAALKPLASLGTSIGTDLAQGLLDSLNAKKTELVALAQSIADAIAAAMAQALAAIGVMNAAKAASDAAAAKAQADAAAALALQLANQKAAEDKAAGDKAVADWLKTQPKATATENAYANYLNGLKGKDPVDDPSRSTSSTSPYNMNLKAGLSGGGGDTTNLTIAEGGVKIIVGGTTATAEELGDVVTNAMKNALRGR